MSAETRQGIIDAISLIPLDTGDPNLDGSLLRVRLAVLMTLTSPDYIVQR